MLLVELGQMQSKAMDVLAPFHKSIRQSQDGGASSTLHGTGPEANNALVRLGDKSSRMLCAFYDGARLDENVVGGGSHVCSLCIVLGPR